MNILDHMDFRRDGVGRFRNFFPAIGKIRRLEVILEVIGGKDNLPGLAGGSHETGAPGKTMPSAATSGQSHCGAFKRKSRFPDCRFTPGRRDASPPPGARPRAGAVCWKVSPALKICSSAARADRGSLLRTGRLARPEPAEEAGRLGSWRGCWPGAGCTVTLGVVNSRSTSCLALLNSSIAWRRPRASSGSFLGPKIIRTTSRMMIRSGPPRLRIEAIMFISTGKYHQRVGVAKKSGWGHEGAT